MSDVSLAECINELYEIEYGFHEQLEYVPAWIPATRKQLERAAGLGEHDHESIQ